MIAQRGIHNWYLATLVTVLAACQASPRQPQSVAPTTQSLRDTLTYLSSDELEGRGIDTPGIQKAAEYIASRFAKAGLRPANGQENFFQTFDYSSAVAVGPSTSFKSANESYKLSDDFTAASFSAEGAFDGPIIFAGYGIVNSGRKYDDYAGIDVKGKVVLVLRYEPHDAKGNSRFAPDGWSPSAGLLEKATAAANHGAVAIILVNPPSFHGPDSLIPFARQYPGAASKIPFIHVRQKVAEELLKRGGAPDLKSLQETIDKGGAPNSVALKDVNVSGSVTIERKTRHLENVVGVLPGHGPRADEYVVVGAHYDHLGYGGRGSLAPSSRAIHHGADDNASGTTAVLALVDSIAKHKPLPRSVIFVCFSAEESGLIGSGNFVNHPPVPLSKIDSMLNLDMVGRLRNEQLYVGGTGTATAFDDLLKRADEGEHIVIKDIGRSGIGPSDHMSFALKKIPVLFLFTGLHADYHRPTDTADKVNYDGIAEIVELSEKLVAGMAEMPKPQYVSAADAHPLHIGGSGGEGLRATLGVVPDYTTAESTAGVRISGTTPGSPADKVGMKDGDVITSWNAKAIANIYDLTAALSAAKPGELVKLKIMRDNHDMTIDATLAERN